MASNKTSFPIRADVVAALRDAQTLLDGLRGSPAYSQAYCDLKRDFFRRYQAGFVFSTRWGGDFFAAALPHVLERRPLPEWVIDDDGSRRPLGEWDRNFNDWLAGLR